MFLSRRPDRRRPFTPAVASRARLWQGSGVPLVLLLVPVIDLVLLVVVGRSLGVWPVLGFVAASGIIGGALARREGGRVMRRMQEARAAGAVSAEGMVGGVLVTAAGMLMAWPGPITTIAGVALLVPPVRRGLAALARRWVERRIEGMIAMPLGGMGGFGAGGPGGPFGGGPGGPFGAGGPFGPGEPPFGAGEPPGRERRPFGGGEVIDVEPVEDERSGAGERRAAGDLPGADEPDR